MTTLEELLREVLADVAGEVDETPDGRRVRRADRALRTVRRRRTAVVLTAAAAAAVVLAGAMLVSNPVERGATIPSTPIPTTPIPTAGGTAAGGTASPLPPLPRVESGLRLTDLASTGGHVLTSYGLKDGGTAVRAPGDADFRRVPYPQASVSRTGAVAVLDSADRTPGTRIGIIADLDHPAVRWVELAVPVLHPVWSPDGRRVLITRMAADGVQPGGRVGFLVVDTTSWAITPVRIEADQDTGTSLGPGLLGLDWDPSGISVVGAVWIDVNQDTGIPRYGLRWWRLDGAEQRTLTTGDVVSSFGAQPLSPSGRRAVVATGKTGLAVLDSRTGRQLARLPGSIAYGWRDEDHLVVEGDSGLVLIGLDGGTVPYAARQGGALYAVAALTPAS